VAKLFLLRPRLFGTRVLRRAEAFFRARFFIEVVSAKQRQYRRGVQKLSRSQLRPAKSPKSQGCLSTNQKGIAQFFAMSSAVVTATDALIRIYSNKEKQYSTCDRQKTDRYGIDHVCWTKIKLGLSRKLWVRKRDE
jgi:hypothetical protein